MNKDKNNSDFTIMRGKIDRVLPKGEFKVKLETKVGEHYVQCRPSGKMRTHYIKMIEGDKVMVKMTPYDLTKGVIVYRGWK